MNCHRRFGCCLLLGGLLGIGVAQAVEEPKPTATPSSWELQLDTTQPARIVVDGKTYWYMVYTVWNNTGREVAFHPEIVRISEIESELPVRLVASQPDDAPKMLVDAALVGPVPKLFKAIKELHAKTHPHLVSPVNAICQLREGRDNAVTSVAIFPELDPRVSKFTIYFGGLTGERQARPNPAYDPSRPSKAGKPGELDDNPKVFVLQKTLAMPYTLPGDSSTRRTATPVLGKMTWVMR